MRTGSAAWACIAISLATSPLSAQDNAITENDAIMEIDTAQELDAIAERIPEREWYPEGYHDIRIAAEADYAEAERMRIANFVATSGEPASAFYGDPSRYTQVNLGNCHVEDYSGADDNDYGPSAYVWLANDMTGFRVALERGGYPEELIGPALRDFERFRLARIALRESGRSADEADFEKEFGLVGVTGEDNALQRLMDTLNDSRTGEYAGLPEVIMADGCGGGGPPVILRMSPGRGQVWIISAFAFRVCSRRNPDPWDKFA